jgi:hypothetical protein
LQPTDRVDCIRASSSGHQPQFTTDGTPIHAIKPSTKVGVGFKGGSVVRHVPTLVDDTPVELQTPAAQFQRVRAFAEEHTRMFTSTNKQLFQTPLSVDRTFI